MGSVLVVFHASPVLASLSALAHSVLPPTAGASIGASWDLGPFVATRIRAPDLGGTAGVWPSRNSQPNLGVCVLSSAPCPTWHLQRSGGLGAGILGRWGWQSRRSALGARVRCSG